MKTEDLNRRRPTLSLSTRVDCRYLATLALYYSNCGDLPRSSSELIRLAVETLTEVLVLNNKVSLIEDHDGAMKILREFGFIDTKHILKLNLAKETAESLQGISLSDQSSPHLSIKELSTPHTLPISSLTHEAMLTEVQRRLENPQDIEKMIKEVTESGNLNPIPEEE